MLPPAGHGLRIVCIALFMFCALHIVEGNSCPTNWTFLDGLCYFFSTQRASWFSARERCKANGGDLVTISSDAENAFVVSHYSSLRCLTEGTWLGLHRHPKNSSRWVWLDDLESELKYTKWHRKEPMNDHLEKNCTEIHPTKSIYWYGRECTALGCYICVRGTQGSDESTQDGVKNAISFVPSDRKNANECNKTDLCSGQPCVNIPGSYRCVCGKGYLETMPGGRDCEDVDECKDNNGGCPHGCINTDGTFVCHCRDGYITENNGTICSPRTGGKTTERTEKKELHIENTNDRKTNRSRATDPPTPESPEDNEQQSGSSEEVLEEPKPSPLASVGVLFTMAIPLCFIVCFLILCYLKGPGKDKSEKEVGISGILIESVSPFLDTAFVDPAETNGNDKGKKTSVKTKNCSYGEDEPMV